jgi:hypothetical protein
MLKIICAVRQAWDLLLADRLDDVGCSMSTLQHRDRQLTDLETQLGRLARPLDWLNAMYCRWIVRWYASGLPYE